MSIFAYDGTKMNVNFDGDSDDQMFIPTDEKVSCNWDYVNVGATNSMKFGTGISLTYAHKNSFSWRVFCDYDYARKTFKAEYNPLAFIKDMSPEMGAILEMYGMNLSKPYTSSTRKSLHLWVLGGAFCVSF